MQDSAASFAAEQQRLKPGSRSIFGLWGNGSGDANREIDIGAHVSSMYLECGVLTRS